MLQIDPDGYLPAEDLREITQIKAWDDEEVDQINDLIEDWVETDPEGNCDRAADILDRGIWDVANGL